MRNRVFLEMSAKNERGYTTGFLLGSWEKGGNTTNPVSDGLGKIGLYYC
jgi:hypothetical protein